MRFQNFTRVFLAIGLIVLPMISFIPSASAQLTFQNPLSGTLGEADLRTTVVNIINLALGLLSLVGVVLVIYGGFVWMTAAGDEQNVEKAKRIISAAVIGLVIVLLAWAIVSFVGNTAKNVTGA